MERNASARQFEAKNKAAEATAENNPVYPLNTRKGPQPPESHTQAKTISSLCANLGRGNTATDIILQSTHGSRTDVPLVQELWPKKKKDSSWLPKLHPAFYKHGSLN